MPGEAARALAAGPVVDQRDACPVGAPCDDLVAEHGSRRRAPELLDVGAAEPAGEHAHRVVRRGHIREPGLSVSVEHDCAHAAS